MQVAKSRDEVLSTASFAALFLNLVPCLLAVIVRLRFALAEIISVAIGTTLVL